MANFQVVPDSQNRTVLLVKEMGRLHVDLKASPEARIQTQRAAHYSWVAYPVPIEYFLIWRIYKS